MTKYIGYDLGDGDTIVSIRENNCNDSVVKDVIMPGYPDNANYCGRPIPSVIGRNEKGQEIIGQDAVENGVEIQVNFKRRPSVLFEGDRTKLRNNIKAFSDALFLNEEFARRVFFDKNGKKDSPIRLYVGRPTMWNENDVKWYEDTFKSCGFVSKYKVEVKLAMESRAAMLNAVNQRAGSGTLAGDFKKIANGSYAVVFDFGSSTTDVTIINRKDDYKIDKDDLGDYNLGARLIDRGIYKWALKQKIMVGMDIPQLHEDNENLKNEAYYFCREAKECYFNTPQQARSKLTPRFGSNDQFPLTLCFCKDKASEAIEFATELPMREFFDSDELKNVEGKWGISKAALGFSWKEACKRLFDRVAQSMKSRGLSPSLVILTGGASRMDFVQQFCKESFSFANLSNSQIVLDPNPSSCVSRGLVYISVVEEKAAKFQQQIDGYCEGLGDIILGKADKLADDIATGLTSTIINKVEDNIKKWKAVRHTTLNGMESAIKSDVKAYMESDDCRAFLERVVRSWFTNVVADQINDDVRKKCIDNDVVYRNQITNAFNLDNLNPLGNTSNFDVGYSIESQVKSTINELIVHIAPFLVVSLGPLVLGIVAPIVGLVVAILAPIIFGILVAAGPVGAPILIAIAGISLVALISGGWDSVKNTFANNVKSADLPRWVRNKVSSEKISTELYGMRGDIRQKIKNSVVQNNEFRDQLKTRLSEKFADVVRLLAKQITMDLTH